MDFSTPDGVGITISEHPQVGTWRMNKTMTAEAPIRLGRSQIDVGFIGAFSYINMRGLWDTSTNSTIDAQSIGRFCMIAHRVIIGMHEHSTRFLSAHPLFLYEPNFRWCENYASKKEDLWEKEISKKNYDSFLKPLPILGNDVWVGTNVTISNGVTIGDGAVVATGAAVTRDVAPYTVVGGVPAKPIKQRFSDKTVEKLLHLKWWDYGADILHGLDLDRPEKAADQIEQRIADGFPKYCPDKFIFDFSSDRFVTIHHQDAEGHKQLRYKTPNDI